MEIKDVDGDSLKCKLFKSDNGNVTVYFKNSGTGISSLPTARDYSEICQLKYAMDHETCIISLSEYDSSLWLISVLLHVKDSSAMISIACSAQGNEPPVSVLFWVLLSLSILLILIGIALLIIRKIKLRKNQIMPSLEPRPRQPDPNERQKLQENYPCVSFEDLKLVNEEKCSICQESFISSSKVRKLGCLHVFHQCCIDVWFDTSPLCPLCKKDYKAYLDQYERTHTDMAGISIMNLDVSERSWLTQ
ncbi:unnamed protein product [Blepharisma stoltei]|uniref:RING-type domain-containing protein n=1 Tax=Blepharisma stoltei TaxID=1481888 RepID=A0AAU9KG75_9CILI|nr:unnamed protein product [Blepharisma stoltei]